MDFVDLGWKLVTLVATTYGVWKGIHELFLGRRSRARDEYRFTKDFFTDLANNPNMHPYQKEKGYRAIAGTDTLSAETIEYLLTLESPERALADYSLGHPYLDHLPHAGDLQISFKKSFESSRSRTLRKILYISLYGVFAFVAAAPFLVSAIWLKAPGHILVTLAIAMCASGS